MNRDTITGIVGAVVLVAAMVGVFMYESDRAATLVGSDAYSVTWHNHTMAGPSAQGATAYQDAATATLTVTEKNLTEAAFTLTWTPQMGTSTLRLTITPPEGSGLEAAENPVEGSGGELTVTYPIPNAIPTATEATGNGADDAHRRLAEDHTATLGTGEWTITVEYTDRTGPAGLPAGGDGQAQWSLETALTHYEPELVER